MWRFIAFLFICHTASSEKHSLSYFLTSTSGIPNLPEFVAVAVVDEDEIGYCDSNKKNPEPRLTWLSKLLEDDPQHLQWYNTKCFDTQKRFGANIEILRRRFNQSEGVHIFQRMNGCEWDDETGDISGFAQYGYDGEDFISLDLKTLTWIAPTTQAVVTKHDWDRDGHRILSWKHAIADKCAPYLQKYMNYKSRFPQETVLPSVSLLQRTSSSPVSCHATGFYPNRAMMFWRRDGEEIHEGVDHGESLPNHDGTFQMSVDLDVSSVAAEDWKRYDCVFQLSGVKEDIVTKLDKAVIRTNEVPPSEFPVAVVSGVVAGLVLLALCIIGFFIWKRQNNGFELATTSDSSERNSDSQ